MAELLDIVIEDTMTDSRGYPLSLSEVIDLDTGVCCPDLLEHLRGNVREVVLGMDGVRVRRYMTVAEAGRLASERLAEEGKA